MKSRISIDVDHDNQPIIKIGYYPSEDVRDKLVKKFLETFGGDSCWARFYYDPANAEIPYREAAIRPICNYDLPEESKIMMEAGQAQLKEREWALGGLSKQSLPV